MRLQEKLKEKKGKKELPKAPLQTPVLVVPYMPFSSLKVNLFLRRHKKKTGLPECKKKGAAQKTPRLKSGNGRSGQRLERLKVSHTAKK